MNIPETEWLAKWPPEIVKQIAELATAYRCQGAPSDLSAWRAAEQHFGDRLNPNLRKAFRA